MIFLTQERDAGEGLDETPGLMMTQGMLTKAREVQEAWNMGREELSVVQFSTVGLGACAPNVGPQQREKPRVRSQ